MWQKLLLLKLSGNQGCGRCLGLWTRTWASVDMWVHVRPVVLISLPSFVSFVLLLLLFETRFCVALVVLELTL